MSYLVLSWKWKWHTCIQYGRTGRPIILFFFDDLLKCVVVCKFIDTRPGRLSVSGAFTLLLSPTLAASLFPAVLLPALVAELAITVWLLSANQSVLQQRLADALDVSAPQR